MSIDRLCLGTAKLGLPFYSYGTSRPDHHESAKILRRADALGIIHFDTARAYGDAEDILECFAATRAIVTTKSAPHLYSAARRLSAFRNVLLHNPTPDQMDGWAEGASVYTEEEVDAAVRAGMTTIQLPYSVYDGRCGGAMARAKKAGKTIYARGPFLQGLPLIEDSTLRDMRVGEAARAHGWSGRDATEQLKVWRELARDHQIPLLHAHLWWSLDSPADFVVFGVGSVRHLEEVVEAAAAYQHGDARWALLREAAWECDVGAPALGFGSLWKR